MKQFFKFLFASLFGTILAVVVLFFLAAGLIAGIAASGSEETEISEQTVLNLDLDYVITERSSNNPFRDFDFSSMEGNNAPGLNDIIKSIKHAATDDKIKGIYIPISFMPNDYATLKEIRDELIVFKQSKKFIIAYGELIDEHGFYIASVADKVYLNPTGTMLLDGFAYTSTYFKGALDKLGIQVELIRHGKFKAAGEPFIAERMSDENRKQIESFMGSIYDDFITSIAVSRKKGADELKTICNQLLIQTPEDALKYGLIDGIKYADEVDTQLHELTGTDAGDNIKFVSIREYKNSAGAGKYNAEAKIAVIYAEGEIVDGEGDQGQVGSVETAAAIAKARKDSSVKAVVLRINSPGGSALASDVIWREVVLTQKVKPVIASMGAVAASGGYYIAAPAQTIMAEPNTITGSIGVFGMIVNAEKLLRDKLGLKFEKVKFGEYADLGSADRAMTPAEKAIMQRMIDRIYNDFIKRVADGRKLTLEQVDSIAQGRVWSGTDAKRIGLVDEFGGLKDAIALAAQKANITEYRLLNLPEQEDPFEKLFKSFGASASTYWMKQQLGENYTYYQQLQQIRNMHGIKARMVWDGKID